MIEKYIHYMTVHGIRNTTDINLNVDYTSIGTRPSEAARAMSMLFLTEWWKEDPLPLMYMI